ncbi:hypothetical protein ScPMuIL_002220 [Solemya velum]
MSKKPAAQTTAASKKGHNDPKTLPVPRPLSPRSGAAQKLPAPKPDSSGSGAAKRGVSGLRLRTTFSVAGDLSVWGGGLCVAGGDLAWVGGRGSVSTVDMAGRVTRTADSLSSLVAVCWCVGGGPVHRHGAGVQGVELGVDVEYALDMSVNSKGDVAVADYNGEKFCILDGQHKHVGTYSPTKSGPFSPHSLTSDGENFVICDLNNNTIDTIDRRGVCLSVYHTADDCRWAPFRVDMLPSNCVWVLFGGGHVCVYDQI